MPTPPRPAGATTTATVITNGLVFDGASPDLVAADIHVEDGTITGIGSADPGSATVIDAAGGVVIPGMVDAHFHAYGIGLDMLELEATPLSYVAIRATRRLGRALARGFTTVRDVAGGDAGLARAIEESAFPSPRYLFTGAALSQTGGHGDPRPGGRHLEPGCCHMTEVVDGVDDLRLATRERLRNGAHAIKVMTSGGVVSLTDPIRAPQYSAAEVAAVCDEATRRGSYVAAHAYSPEAIVHSVVNGVHSIEHGNLLDARTAAVMADHGAVLVPTLATYDAMDRRGNEVGMAQVSMDKNREVLQAGQHAVELAMQAGVPVGFGSDLMGPLEDEQLQGLRLQAEVQGMAELLRSATSVNADLLGRPDLGRIVEGGVADLVILDGNPFEEPDVLWSRQRTVVQAGVPIAT